MPLPTTNLTLHCDASDTDKLFTTYDSGGSHSGVPKSGDAIQIWDDEGDGVGDVAMKFTGTGAEPDYRLSVPLMDWPCLDFNGATDALGSQNQNGTAAKAASSFVTASAFTILIAFFPESITKTNASAFSNHCLIGDAGQFFGLYLKDLAGVKKLVAYNWDGNADVVELTIAEGVSCVAMLRHEGGNLYLSVNGGAESSVASGNTSSLAAALRLGLSGALTHYNGRIGEFAVWNSALSGSDLADAIEYFTAKWLSGEVSEPSNTLFDEDFSVENTGLKNFNEQIYETGTGYGTIGFWNVKAGDDITGGELVPDVASSLIMHDMSADRARLAGRCHYMRFRTKSTGSFASLWWGIGKVTSPQWFLGQGGLNSGLYLHTTAGHLRDIGYWRSSPASNYQYQGFVSHSQVVEFGMLERGPSGLMTFARVNGGGWVLISLEPTSSGAGTVTVYNQGCPALEAIEHITTTNTDFAPTPLVQHSFDSAVSPSDGAGQLESGGSGVSAVTVGDLEIAGNVLQLASDGAGLCVFDCGFDDWLLDVVLTIHDGSPCGVVVRYVDANNYLYVEINSSTDTLKVIEVVSGSPTTLVTSAFNPGSTDTYDLADGAEIRLTVRSRGGALLTATIFPGSLHDTYIQSTTTRFAASTTCGVYLSKGAGVNSATAEDLVVFESVQSFPLPDTGEVFNPAWAVHQRRLLGIT